MSKIARWMIRAIPDRGLLAFVIDADNSRGGAQFSQPTADDGALCAFSSIGNA